MKHMFNEMNHSMNRDVIGQSFSLSSVKHTQSDHAQDVAKQTPAAYTSSHILAMLSGMSTGLRYY